MKVIIVSCVVPPETVVSGRINWDIANYLVKNNNEVILISPIPTRPIGNFPNEDLFDKKLNNGIRHIRIKTFTYPHRGFIGRVLESISFGYESIKLVNKLDCEILYSMPWPFLGQFIINILLKNKKTKVIMNVQDLYPESFLSKIKFFGFFFKPLKYIDLYSAKKSFHLTVVSQSLKNFYVKKRSLRPNKITVIENWQDEKKFLKGPSQDKASLINKFNLNNTKDKKIYMYLGNIGPVAGVYPLIKAFHESNLHNHSLVIAGSGTSKKKCFNYVKKNDIKNIFFRDVPPGLDSVVDLQSLADVMILPINKGFASSSIPSKLIAYMFSAKPILTNADKDSFTYQAVVNSKSGWVTKSFKDWFNKMNLYEIEDKLKIYGSNGFNYAIKNYSKTQGLKKINNLFKLIKNESNIK